MNPEHNLVGKTFGKFSVISYAGSTKGGSSWNCKCACGNIVVRTGPRLRAAQPNYNCGCIYTGTQPGDFLTIVRRHVVGVIIQRAIRRMKVMDLSRQQILELIEKPCHYCGAIGSNVVRLSKRKAHIGKEYRHNGLDRVDSAIGYTVANTVPCCRECNHAKFTLSPIEYIAHCARVIAHQQSHKL
jgi:hypothetical protein